LAHAIHDLTEYAITPVTASESGLPDAGLLLDQLATEERHRQLEAILWKLRQMPEVRDCGPVLPLTRHRSSLVRHEAITVLGQCSDPRAEEALLGVLADPHDDYDRISANAALGQCGSRAAIPALAAQIHDRVDDVKCSAIYALMELGDSSLVPVFLDALSDRSSTAKWYAMHAIERHGNQLTIRPVCAAHLPALLHGFLMFIS
jgi:HEAT repeat protein